jgi:pimeloyl-ACP methyl ester carboxylesterase
VFPRYRGTWESEGVFLLRSPVRDIEDLFFHLLKDGNITELYGNRTFKINTKNLILVGASFGGAVALCAATTPAVKKVIALSPVVDWKNYAGSKTPQAMSHLKRFLRNGFGEAYRFDVSGWEKFERGKLFNPPQKIAPAVAKKIIIVQDNADTAVSPERVAEYAKAEKIKIKKTKGYGHISFSRFPAVELLKLIG